MQELTVSDDGALESDHRLVILQRMLDLFGQDQPPILPSAENQGVILSRRTQACLACFKLEKLLLEVRPPLAALKGADRVDTAGLNILACLSFSRRWNELAVSKPRTIGQLRASVSLTNRVESHTSAIKRT
jgi:hypothetical protein